jgi:hypothetical protein
VGGVVAFTLDRPQPSDSQLAAWRARKGAGARFQPLPLTTVRCSLLLVDPAAPTEEGLAVARRSAPWTARSFSVGLSSEQASLLWAELEQPGNLGLVADVELVAEGYALRGGESGPAVYERTERRDRFSVALPVSRQQHPELFAVVHGAEKAAFDYRELTLFCFDFVNQSIPGLALVSVEVETTTPRGQRERHSDYFTPDGEAIRTLELRVPLPPGAVHRYRVTRVLDSGETLAGPWKQGAGPFLDVSETDLEIKETPDA